MFKTNGGLFWPPFFSSENDVNQITENVKNRQGFYSKDKLTSIILNLSHIQCCDSLDNSLMGDVCEHIVLSFMINDTTMAKDFLSEEEFFKAKEVFIRKQYNSKILQKLLSYFEALLDLYPNDYLNNLFTLSLIHELDKVKQEKIDNEYSVLKKVIDKEASGVKSTCYLDAQTITYLEAKTELTACLNDYIIELNDYNFNSINTIHVNNETSTLLSMEEFITINNQILQKSLVNNQEFWNEHQNFSITRFLNSILENNGLTHAKKVIKYMFNNIQEMQYMKEVILQNKLPLCMSRRDIIIERLEEQAFRFSFKRLEQYCDLSPLKSLLLCYPMNDVSDDCINEGKKVWDKFICSYNYPLDYNKVNEYLNNDVEAFVSGNKVDVDNVGIIFDVAPFRFQIDNEDRKIFNAYYANCFSSENIWKRVYIKAYGVTKLSNDETIQMSYLQRIYIDVIKTIEKKLGICTVHQLNNEKRDINYKQLKNLLKLYNIEVSDEHKTDYIVALLDRDTSTIEETKKFPILEQIGDAIYGLSVCELLFYNPSTKKMGEMYEKYTRAESQVIISKKLGFDKMYLNIGVPSKYIEYDSLYFDIGNITLENLKTFNKEKYLADSLEMIIGAIYLDKGLEVAIKFSKAIIKNAFPQHFYNEIHITEQERINENIDKNYWQKILPSPWTNMNSDLYILWNALTKVILTVVIGNENKDKRNYITQHIGHLNLFKDNSNNCVNWLFYDYLNHGILYVINKYEDEILNKYLNK